MAPKIKFTPSPDGKTTVVRIPQAAEAFEPKDGKLYSEATVDTSELLNSVAVALGVTVSTTKGA